MGSAGCANRQKDLRINFVHNQPTQQRCWKRCRVDFLEMWNIFLEILPCKALCPLARRRVWRKLVMCQVEYRMAARVTSGRTCFCCTTACYKRLTRCSKRDLLRILQSHQSEILLPVTTWCPRDSLRLLVALAEAILSRSQRGG